MTHPILTEAYTAAETTLEDLEALLARTSDADIHRAHPQGGWTCSQIVTHISLSGITLIALLERYPTGLLVLRQGSPLAQALDPASGGPLGGVASRLERQTITAMDARGVALYRYALRAPP